MEEFLRFLARDDSDDSDEEDQREGDEREEGQERHRIPMNLFLLQMLQMNNRRNDTHEELVKNLLKYETDLLPDSLPHKAFQEIRRDSFVPDKYKEIAFNDSPLDIKELNTNLSSPHIYPKCLLLLDIDPQLPQAILDIGCGTGWFTVLAARVASENSTVEGWDLTSDIINEANKCLSQFDESLTKKITYKVHNAFWPRYHSCSSKFDRIHVGASIPVEERFHIYNLLKPGGKLVSPIAEGLFVVENHPEKGFIEKSHLDVRYRMLLLPEKIPVWIPKLSVHEKYPPVIQEQISCVFKIYCLRDTILSYLPLEILYQILSWLYRNPVQKLTSSYLQFLKQNEIQFRRLHHLERDYFRLFREESSESEDDESGEEEQLHPPPNHPQNQHHQFDNDQLGGDEEVEEEEEQRAEENFQQVEEDLRQNHLPPPENPHNGHNHNQNGHNNQDTLHAPASPPKENSQPNLNATQSGSPSKNKRMLDEENFNPVDGDMSDSDE